MRAPLDAAVLAERSASVERHLGRVAEQPPDDAGDLRPSTEASDAVILHLWQAVQIVIDLALSLCVARGLGAPPTDGDAFRTLQRDGVIDEDLAARLARVAGFRHVLVHAYAELDLRRVHGAARTGPADLRRFLAAVRDHLST